MRDLPPPFKFDVSSLVGKARCLANKRVAGVTINLPFVSFSVRPDDLEQKVAREIVIRLADKRVLNAFECCDSCVEKAMASLQDIRALLVDKQVELSSQVDSGLYLVVEVMLEGIRQFSTFEESLRTVNPEFPGDIHTRLHRHDLHPYFAALEMLRGHLYRCLAQVAIVADTTIPKIATHMRYDSSWQIAAYKQPDRREEREDDVARQVLKKNEELYRRLA
jgi:hypothetical protein